MATMVGIETKHELMVLVEYIIVTEEIGKTTTHHKDKGLRYGYTVTTVLSSEHESESRSE